MSRLNTEILIYSNQSSDYVPGFRYANPRFFNGSIRSDVKRVVVVGSWPAVVETYSKAGIPVSQVDYIGCAADITGAPSTVAPVPSPPTPAPTKAADPSTVAIPVNWADLEWPQLRSLAAELTDKPVTSKRVASETIEAEIKRRAAAALAPAPQA